MERATSSSTSSKSVVERSLLQIWDCSIAKIPRSILPRTASFEPISCKSLTGQGNGHPHAYSQLSSRVWSVDHDEKGFTKRYCNLTISQFSGERAIGALRYIPTGYQPDENKKRSHLLARGKLLVEVQLRCAPVNFQVRLRNPCGTHLDSTIGIGFEHFGRMCTQRSENANSKKQTFMCTFGFAASYIA